VGPIKTKAKSLGNDIRLLNPGNMEKSIVSYHSGHMSPLAPSIVGVGILLLGICPGVSKSRFDWNTQETRKISDSCNSGLYGLASCREGWERGGEKERGKKPCTSWIVFILFYQL